MATVYQDRAGQAGFHPVQSIAAWLVQRVAVWTASRRRAREMREIMLFSDRDLWDVGLSRSDLMALEKGVYRRD
jgi:uncharacterized protein YjiS (DUF1127 family)